MNEIETITNDFKNYLINNYIEKENVEIIEEKTSLAELIDTLKTDKNVSLEWWSEYKRKIKSGDIVYIPNIKKFGIFICPAVKKDKVRIRLLKNEDKNSAYTTDWFFDYNEIKIVKHNNKLTRSFTETEDNFIYKYAQ
jgi:hypothetical protein